MRQPQRSCSSRRRNNSHIHLQDRRRRPPHRTPSLILDQHPGSRRHGPMALAQGRAEVLWRFCEARRSGRPFLLADLEILRESIVMLMMRLDCMDRMIDCMMVNHCEAPLCRYSAAGSSICTSRSATVPTLRRWWQRGGGCSGWRSTRTCWIGCIGATRKREHQRCACLAPP